MGPSIAYGAGDVAGTVGVGIAPWATVSGKRKMPVASDANQPGSEHGHGYTPSTCRRDDMT